MSVKVFASINKKPSLLSRLIMRKIRQKYSHVGIIFNDTIYHAVGEGVVRETMEEFLKKRTIVHEFDVTSKLKVPEERLYGWLEGRLGTEYSTSAYFAFVVPKLLKFVSSGSSKVVCSEFAYAFLVFAKLLRKDHYLSEDIVNPEMLVRAAKGIV